MHIMFVHPNFPAQFGEIANRLTQIYGWKCTFVTSVDTSHHDLPFVRVSYPLNGQPPPKQFMNQGGMPAKLDHLASIYRGLRRHPEISPDLVVGHTFFGTMLYLRNLYDCPFVGYFELLPPPFWSKDLVLRHEFPPSEENRLAQATQHSLTHLQIHAADACYTPTQYQLSTAPKELQGKMRVIFDGVNTATFCRKEVERPTAFRGVSIPTGTRVVTYVSRGLESIRGFDIFMKVAKRIYTEMDDVLFLIAGQDRTCYGHELEHIEQPTFKQHVLEEDEYDLSRFHFLDLIPTAELPTLYNLSDLHIYLTAPYVLSWSLVQAMSNGCTILGSATPPVQEVIDDGVHGLLAQFDDIDGLAEKALHALRQPDSVSQLGPSARQRVMEKYDADICLKQLVGFFEELVNR